HQHVHGGVHLVLLAALPLDLQRGRDAGALGLAGAQLGGGGGGQREGRAGAGLGQLVAFLHELATRDAGLHAGRHQVGGELLLGVDVADHDDAAVVADGQQLDDAFALGGDDDVLGQLGDRLAALVALVLLDEVLLRDEEAGVARLLVVEPDAAREAVLRDAGDLRLHALGELLAGFDPLAVGHDRVLAAGDRVGLLQAVAELTVLLVGEQVAALQRPVAEAGVLGVGDDVLGEVQDLLELRGREVQQGPDLVRDVLDVPDVRARGRQLDMAHAVAAHRRARDLDAAALAGLAGEALAAVLAAGALPVLLGPEDLLVEEA